MSEENGYEDFARRLLHLIETNHTEEILHDDVVMLFRTTLLPITIKNMDSLIITKKRLKDMVNHVIGYSLREVTLNAQLTPSTAGPYLATLDVQLATGILISKLSNISTDAVYNPKVYEPWFDRIIDDLTPFDLLAANLYNSRCNHTIRTTIDVVCTAILTYLVLQK